MRTLPAIALVLLPTGLLCGSSPGEPSVRDPSSGEESQRAGEGQRSPKESEDAEHLDAIRSRGREVLQGLVDRGLPGASAAVVLPDGTVLSFAVGDAEPATEEVPAVSLTPAHRLLLGSVGKTFVTAAAHRLVSERALDFEESLAHYLSPDQHPWIRRVPNGEEVTIRQLLQHQSGIPRYVFKPEFARELAADIDRKWSPLELVAFVFDDEPMFEAGEQFVYSDTNYILIGMVIEELTGGSFYDYVAEHFLSPNALRDTVPSDRRDIPGMAQGTVVLGGELVGVDRALEGGVFAYNPQFEWCGGGFACTPADLARWTWLLYSGAAIEHPYLETLLDGVVAPELGPGMEYGLGAMMTETTEGAWVGHDGFMPGYLTSTGYFPDSEFAGTVQLNSDDMRAVGRRLSAVVVELVGVAIEEVGRANDSANRTSDGR